VLQGLLVAASPGVDVVSLGERANWTAVPSTLPVVALAFVFHNVVPVVVQALEGDRRKVSTAICAGVAIPWLMFVSWEAAILGSLGSLQAPPAAAVGQAGGPTATGSQLQQQVQAAPPTAVTGSRDSQTTSSSSSNSTPDPLAALAASNATVGPLIQGFSFLAIATSFIGFILGLTDFFVDGLKLPNRQAPVPYMLTLLPPFAVAVSNPNIFLQALDTAGRGAP
jgi:tyrosine-specific transport protein